jgi:hypothetical protein
VPRKARLSARLVVFRSWPFETSRPDFFPLKEIPPGDFRSKFPSKGRYL